MDTPILTNELLENLPRPAFLVKDGVIIQANAAAAQLGILRDTPVLPLIGIGKEEYARFESGRLCLTLTCGGIHYHAVVFQGDCVQLFSLEPEANEPEMRTLALVAQQLREPLSNALLSANALLPEAQLQQLPDVQLQLAKINQNLLRIHRAICNMSDVGQLATPRLTKAEYRNVNAIVGEIMEKAAAYMEHTGRHLAYTGLDQSVATVVDAEKLERAVLNLLSNAVKFSDTGAVISAELRKSGSKLYVSVSAEARNPEQPIGNLFSQFLRSPGLEAPEHGIGLGLSVVRQVAAAHGGTLLVDRMQDTGAIRFTLSLAVRHAEGGLNAPVLRPGDYAGGYDHMLLELSDILPPELYK